MRNLLITSALCLAPMAATADDQLDRFASVMVDMNVLMGEMMALEIEQGGGDGTPVRDALALLEWTPALQTAAACVQDKFADVAGPDTFSTMLDDIEAVIADSQGMTMTEFAESMDPMALIPQGMTQDESLAINEECGLPDAQLAAMSETGFTAAVMAAMSESQ